VWKKSECSQKLQEMSDEDKGMMFAYVEEEEGEQ
jgi:hypothetical protein